MKLYGFALFILNLFPSGFSENLLRTDATGYSLSLFLFCHSAAYLLLALSYVSVTSREILHKAEVFPTRSISRLLFVIVGSIRHPIAIALLASNALFFLLLFRHDGIAAGIAFLIYLLLMISISVVTSFVFLFMEKRRIPAGIALLCAALLIVAGLAGSFVFHSELIMESVPLVGVCVRGIQSAVQGKYLSAVTAVAVLIGIQATTIILGTKFT
jgi:hypothetical protein